MHPTTTKTYEAALRASFWNKDMAVAGLSIAQQEIAANRDRRLRYAALLGALAVAALALVTCGCQRPAPLAPSSGAAPRSIVEQHEAAVTIQATCAITSDGEVIASLTAPAGSGVIVSEYEILTAYHVLSLTVASVPGLECSFTAIDWSGTEHPLQVSQRSPLDDVARLRSFVPFVASPVVVAPAPLPGERVCTVSRFPWRARRCGDVQVGEDPVPGQRSGNLVWDGIVEPGNSGSGVYDQRGRLVALATHKMDCPTTSGQLCFGRGTRLYPLLPWVLGDRP